MAKTTRNIEGIQLDDLEEGRRYIVERDIKPLAVAGIFRGLEKALGGRGQVALEVTGGRFHRVPVQRITKIRLVEPTPIEEAVSNCPPAKDDPGDGPPNVRIAE